MKVHLAGVFLCAALLTATTAPRLAVAGNKEVNKFNEDVKNDLEFKGSITALDATAGSVTVKNKEKGPMTFSIAKDCLLFVKRKKGAPAGAAALTDFKVGEDVRVLYRQEGAATVCHSMWQPGSNPAERQRVIEDHTKTP